MNIKTHKLADMKLLGTPVYMVDDSEAFVELETMEKMCVDETGLIHGGFTFCLADYAAMLAVNEPTVVLAEVKARSTAPVIVGEKMTAHARVVERDGRKRMVVVDVMVDDKKVMEGEFLCLILREHILSRKA